MFILHYGHALSKPSTTYVSAPKKNLRVSMFEKLPISAVVPPVNVLKVNTDYLETFFESPFM